MSTWISRTSGVSTNLYLARFGNGVFLAVEQPGSGAGNLVRSADGGVTWTTVTLPGISGSAAIYDLAYAAGVWIAVGQTSTTTLLVLRSTDDGVTWTSVTGLPVLGSGRAGAVAFKAGTWLLTGTTIVTGANNYMVSTDGGLTWTRPGTFTCDQFGVGSINVDGTNFFAFCDVSGVTKIVSSPDGSTWTVVSNAPPNFQISGSTQPGSIAFGSGIYISPNNNGFGGTVRVASTLAGLISAADTAVGLSGFPIQWVQFGGSSFVAVDGAGGVSSSPDGVTWTPGVLNFSSGFAKGVAFGGGVFVAVGSSGHISTMTASVTVPNVVLDTLSVATAAIIAAGLIVGVVSGAVNFSVPIGEVISQSPAGGSSTTPGSSVDLVLSIPPPVPEVTGSVLAGAGTTIVGTGFIVGDITFVFSDTIPYGLVISEIPAGGGAAPPGSSIDLVVSLGPFPKILAKTLNSYLYQQYADDDDLQAFVISYNGMTQTYLDWFNTVALPYYPGLSGDLLNWVVLGLYGLPRTSLQASSTPALGMLNTEELNTNPLNSFIPATSTFYQLTNDVYQRILTWNFYKGDGKRFCMRWLKRRVMRFLVGVKGVDPQPQNALVGAENTQAISASVASNVLTVQISQSKISSITALTPGILQAFQEAFQGQALELPAQYSSYVCALIA